MNQFKTAIIIVVASIGWATTALAAKTGTAEIKDYKGKKVGVASFFETPEGVVIQAEIRGLPPGAHGIHVHERGTCLAPTFKSAGDHFDPGKKAHGLESEQGAHAGDLPNLEVAGDGTASYRGVAKGAILQKGKNSFLKSGGTAIVIHSKEDDQVSDPAGNSGDRIACGVIKASK